MSEEKKKLVQTFLDGAPAHSCVRCALLEDQHKEFSQFFNVFERACIFFKTTHPARTLVPACHLGHKNKSYPIDEFLKTDLCPDFFEWQVGDTPAIAQRRQEESRRQEELDRETQKHQQILDENRRATEKIVSETKRSNNITRCFLIINIIFLCATILVSGLSIYVDFKSIPNPEKPNEPPSLNDPAAGGPAEQGQPGQQTPAGGDPADTGHDQTGLPRQ